MPQQVTDIAAALTFYSHIGTGRDGIGQGESSNIYHEKDRFILTEQTTFWLSETPDTVSKGWDAAYRRVCTYGLFKDKKSKKYFGFLIHIWITWVK